MMPSLGMPELIIILVIALIIFGPRKLPELGRSLGKSIGEFRKASNELKSTLEEEIRLEEQKEQRAKVEAEQASAISAADVTPAPPLGNDAGEVFTDKPAEPTVGRTTTGTPA
jgi:TatA/E family protein of Tat protein translocase